MSQGAAEITQRERWKQNGVCRVRELALTNRGMQACGGAALEAYKGERAERPCANNLR
ncbi:MAG: hypothetical protein N2595_01625 [bacterium]|nr:hypothetical protein [bacterium]